MRVCLTLLLLVAAAAIAPSAGLAPGVTYRCTVRAKSRFGYGPGRGVDMPRG